MAAVTYEDLDARFSLHEQYLRDQIRGKSKWPCLFRRKARAKRCWLYDAEVSECTIAGRRLEQLWFERCSFRQVAWVHCDLWWAQFCDCAFEKCEFRSCHFSNAGFNNVRAQSVRFVECSFKDAELHDSSLEGAAFEKCFLGDATFQSTDLRRVSFNGSRLKRTSFEDVVLWANSAADLAEYTPFVMGSIRLSDSLDGGTVGGRECLDRALGQ
jgi:uncharacterized protein YjbI with pentapeptide repeats